MFNDIVNSRRYDRIYHSLKKHAIVQENMLNTKSARGDQSLGTDCKRHEVSYCYFPITKAYQ